jgi:hypothetical protein
MFANPRTALQTDRFRQSLRVVPVRNTHVVALPSDDPRELHLGVSLRYGPIIRILRLLLKARTQRCYVLEGIGREVYEDIDGRSTFEQLIDRFAARRRLTFFESRALLAQYCQLLAKRGLIVATLPRNAPAP